MVNRSPTTFGALLRRYRLAAMLTQEQLAVRAQLSTDTIRALESGKRHSPRPYSLHLLVEALSLTKEQRESLLAATQPHSSLLTGEWVALPPNMRLGTAQPNPLVGRERELQTIYERLAPGDDATGGRARLLTLTGPAGVGKTRLALAAAAQLVDYFPDGVTLVDLAPVRDPAQVLSTVARAIGLADIGNRPLIERLCEYVHERSLLLALDNFEHVLPAAGALADLLATCPRLTLLVTSRIPLHLRWEWTLRLEPLPTPNLHADLPPIETLAEIPSVALFVARAQARRGDFAMSVTQAHLVAQLTAELDGLPLAIELAAARLDVLPLQVIVHRLGDRMRLLHWDAQDVPIRQHSLEAAIGWSYELLSQQEQQLFRCLGVFCGQVSLPSIATVVAAVADHDEQPVSRERRIAADKGHILAGLSSLAEKSLVLSARGQESHGRLSDGQDDSDLDLTFHMLETVREYAWERLIAEGELDVAQQAHAQYFRLLANRAGAHLRGPDQRIWLLRLEHEHDNLRAALHWGLRDDEDEGISAVGRSEDALQLAADLGFFWWARGYLAEGSRWLEAALRRAPDADPTLRIRALTHSGPLLTYQGAFDSAKRALEQARTLAEALAETQEEQSAELARIILYRGLCAVYAGDVTQSIPLLQEALRRADALEDHHLAGLASMFLGGAAFAQAQLEQATALFEESLIHFETAGDSIFAGNNYVHMGMLTGRRGDLSHAVRYIRKGLEAGIAFEERRLLSVAVQVALSLPVGSNRPDDLAQRAQLLGAVDMLSQATGRTLLQTLLASSLDMLREQFSSEHSQALYMQGRSAPFAAVASLARTFLDDLADTLGSRESAPDVDSMAARPHTQRDSLLSPRQRDVLQLVALGLSNKAIGQRLYLSPSTVTYHLSSAFNKLGVDTRAHAVAVATQQGLL